MTKMTTSELRAYRQICGADGMMMVVACDQRGAMRKLLASDPAAQAKIGAGELGQVKADIIAHLANEASCVLLDPVCALPHVVTEGVLARDTALLIGLDDSGWDAEEGTGYRLSKLVPGVTARRVRALGGTGAKLLVYLRPDLPAANGYNLGIIDACVADFAREDLLLVVEILTYQVEGEDAAEYGAQFPDLIVGCARMALDHGAKVLKLPYPGTEAACREISAMAGEVPWAVLSAGVDHETFLGQVETAVRAGASGVIAGRSLWKDCISLDPEVRRERLRTIATPRLRMIQEILRASRGETAQAA
ncbi:MAG: tagatose-bisphosphate aldolase [Proteobacteria bacterium]|nr:tagatose-bisphosphate aldolase [Pseudomonadota bacterium]